MIDNHKCDRIFEVVDEMVKGGVTPIEFIKECANAWETSLRDRLRYEPDEILRGIK